MSTEEKVALKFQIHAIKKIAKKKFDAKITYKNDVKHVDFCDVDKFPIYINGKVKFKKGDIESRKEGVFILLDVSEKDGFPPCEQARLVALGEREGQHFVVLVTKTGMVVQNDIAFWKKWIFDIGNQANATIRLIEISKQKLLSFSVKKPSKLSILENEIKETHGKILRLQLERQKEVEALVVLEQQPQVDEAKVLLAKKQIETLQHTIDKYYKFQKDASKRKKKLDVKELSSDDEDFDAEKFEENLAKRRKILPKTPTIIPGEPLFSAMLNTVKMPIKLSKEDKKIEGEMLGDEETDDDVSEDETVNSDMLSSEEESSDGEDSESGSSSSGSSSGSASSESEEEEDDDDDESSEGEAHKPIEIE